MGIEDRLPPGGKVDDGRPMGDAGCMSGVEDTYGAGGGALGKGMTDRMDISGGKQRGDGMQER